MEALRTPWGPTGSGWDFDEATTDLELLVQNLSELDSAILRGRLLTRAGRPRVRAIDLATAFSTTVEAIRQRARELRLQLRDCGACDLLTLATGVITDGREVLPPWALHIEQLPREMLTTHGDALSGVDYLVAAGFAERDGEWLENRMRSRASADDYLTNAEVLIDQMARSGLRVDGDESTTPRLLMPVGLQPRFLRDWVCRHGGEVIDGVVTGLRLPVTTALLRVLSDSREPLSMAQIRRQLRERYPAHSIAKSAMIDRRIRRVGPDAYTLATRGLPAYRGFHEEMEAMVRQRGEVPMDELITSMVTRFGVKADAVRVTACNHPFVCADDFVRMSDTSCQPAPDLWSLPQRDLDPLVQVKDGFIIDAFVDDTTFANGMLTLPSVVASVLNLVDTLDAQFPLRSDAADDAEDHYIQFRWECDRASMFVPEFIAGAQPKTGDVLRLHVHGRPGRITSVSLTLMPACVAAETRLLHGRMCAPDSLGEALGGHLELLGMRVKVEEPLDHAAAQWEVARMVVQQFLEASATAAKTTDNPNLRLGRIIVRSDAAGDGAQVEWMWNDDGLFLIFTDHDQHLFGDTPATAWFQQRGFHSTMNNGVPVQVLCIPADSCVLAEVSLLITNAFREACDVDVNGMWRFSPSALAEVQFAVMPETAPQWCGGLLTQAAIRRGLRIGGAFAAPQWLQPWLAPAHLECRPVEKPRVVAKMVPRRS